MKLVIRNVFLLFLMFLSFPLYSQVPYQEGFPAHSYGDIYGQIKVVDLDGDGKKEMIFGAVDGGIHIYDSKGKEIRTGFFPKRTGGPIMSDVEVADVDGDGKKEIIATSFDGRIYVLNNKGKVKWEKKLGSSAVFNSPVVVDLNGDGKKEIIASSVAGEVRVFNSDGEEKWHRMANSQLSSSPIIADLDGEQKGNKEVILRNNIGEIEVYTDKGLNKRGFPVAVGGNVDFWPYEPAAADIDGDGKKEIIIPNPSTSRGAQDQTIAIINKEGKIVKRIRVGMNIADKVKIADINGDGNPDMVFATEDGKIGIIDVKKTMEQDGSEVKPQYFPSWPKKVAKNIQAVPNIADVDGDGKLDIVFTAYNPKEKGLKCGKLCVIDPETGRMKPGFPKYIGKSTSKVTFADLDGDGDVEIIVSGGLGLTGKQIHVFDCPAKLIFKLAVLGIKYEY
jgi:outer membrane protein assembly factor BamB